MTGSNIQFSDVLKEYYGATAPAHEEHYTNRFRIFCKVFDLIENTGAATNNGFIWKGNQMTVKQPILNKMEDFANFWYDQFDEYNLFINSIIQNRYNFTEKTYVLTKFLTYLKTKIQIENPSYTFS